MMKMELVSIIVVVVMLFYFDFNSRLDSFIQINGPILNFLKKSNFSSFFH